MPTLNCQRWRPRANTAQQPRADNISVSQQPSGGKKNLSIAELGASYKARNFIAVPALGHPVHLPFPSADIPPIWCPSSLASKSIPMMLRKHIQTEENGETMPTVREIEHQKPFYATPAFVSICHAPPVVIPTILSFKEPLLAV